MGSPEVGRWLSKIWASDGHNHQDLGQRFTWVKMTRPNLDGLRLALSDGSASLQPGLRDDMGELNTCTDLMIESITVQKAKYLGQSSPVTVRFNPWLNAIIGGRGTGKSTLIDFCRKALCREDELKDSDTTDEGSLRSVFDRRMRVPASRNEEGLLTAETRIEVMYRKDEARFLLSWRQDNQRHSIERITDGTPTLEEGDTRERFPVRIYSQKQLFELAQHPNALLAVIDDSQLVYRIEMNRSMEQKRTEYLSLCAAARAARNRAKELPARRVSLKDDQHKLNVLKEGKHEKVMSEYGLRRRQNEAWTGALRKASQAVESVGDAAGNLAIPELNVISIEEDSESASDVRQLHRALNDKVKTLQLLVQERVRQTLQEIEELRNGDESLAWRNAVGSVEALYQRAIAQLEQEGISGPSEYDSLLQQEGKLKKEIEALQKEQAQVIALETKADGILKEYRKLRIELSERRTRFAEVASGDTLQVETESLSNYHSLATDLSRILAISHFEEDREATAKRIQPLTMQSWD